MGVQGPGSLSLCPSSNHNPYPRAQAKAWAYISLGTFVSFQHISGYDLAWMSKVLALFLYVCLLTLTLGNPYPRAQAEAWAYISLGTFVSFQHISGCDLAWMSKVLALFLYVCLLTLTLGNPYPRTQAEAWAYISLGTFCQLLTHFWLRSGMDVQGPGSLSLCLSTNPNPYPR